MTHCSSARDISTNSSNGPVDVFKADSQTRLTVHPQSELGTVLSTSCSVTSSLPASFPRRSEQRNPNSVLSIESLLNLDVESSQSTYRYIHPGKPISPNNSPRSKLRSPLDTAPETTREGPRKPALKRGRQTSIISDFSLPPMADFNPAATRLSLDLTKDLANLDQMLTQWPVVEGTRGSMSSSERLQAVHSVDLQVGPPDKKLKMDDRLHDQSQSTSSPLHSILELSATEVVEVIDLTSPMMNCTNETPALDAGGFEPMVVDLDEPFEENGEVQSVGIIKETECSASDIIISEQTLPERNRPQALPFADSNDPMQAGLPSVSAPLAKADSRKTSDELQLEVEDDISSDEGRGTDSEFEKYDPFFETFEVQLTVLLQLTSESKTKTT